MITALVSDLLHLDNQGGVKFGCEVCRYAGVIKGYVKSAAHYGHCHAHPNRQLYFLVCQQ